MATAPTTADGGALAIRPARANIFAKPDAREAESSQEGHSSAGVFDDASACRSADELAHRFVPGSDARAGLASVAARRRCAPLIALAAATSCVLIAIATHQRSHRAPSTPPPPSLRPSQQPRVSDASEGRRSPRRTHEHRGAKTHHRTHRPARSTGTTRRTPTRLQHTPAPQLLQPRVGPGVSPPPPRAVPAPVPRAAPPEFM
jgi:hypothetical protein